MAHLQTKYKFRKYKKKKKKVGLIFNLDFKRSFSKNIFFFLFLIFYLRVILVRITSEKVIIYGIKNKK
jgi:hypothetical protein